MHSVLTRKTGLAHFAIYNRLGGFIRNRQRITTGASTRPPPSDDGGVAADVARGRRAATAWRDGRLHRRGSQMGLEPVNRDCDWLIAELEGKKLGRPGQHAVWTAVLRRQQR